MNRRLIPLALAAAMAATALAAPGQAQAVNASQSSIVSENPADFTPQVQDGEVEAVAQVGNTIVIGGSFHTIKDSTETTTFTRNFLAAFDATTGEVLSTFQPLVNGEVTSLAAGPGGTVYVGGAFTTVAGSAQQGLAYLNVATGARVGGFVGVVGANNGGTGAQVNSLVLHGGVLYVGGRFSKVTHAAVRNGFAALVATSGEATSLNLPVTGPRAGSTVPFVRTLDVSADGSALVLGGNFTAVAGAAREQVAVVDLLHGTVRPWQTTQFHAACMLGNLTYVNQVNISPDGSYFVVAATGGWTVGSVCDAASRWELGSNAAGQLPTWVDLTGGDSLNSVAVTGAAVYVAGHPRWFNNSNGTGNNAGDGSVNRQTIAALDPTNGLPLAWNPTMARPGLGNTTTDGPQALLATSAGLWVGWDSDTVGAEVHKRITFFPLAGGTPATPVTATHLPANLFVAGSDGSLTKRTVSADGGTYGIPAAVPSPGGVAWDQITGGFIADGQVFYSTADGKLHQASFDGTTVGASSNVSTWFDLSGITAMTYDNGRIYYTRGDGKLWYRYFLPSTGLVGSQEFVGNTPAFGVFDDGHQMFISDGALYDSHGGQLYRIPMSNGVVNGNAALIGTAGTGWTGTATMPVGVPRIVLPPAGQHDFTGDGHGDLLGRDASGTLWIYVGNNAGSFSTRSSLGSGWNAMNLFITPGDFDGDGRADIITRDAAGRLWLYPGKAPATISPRKQIGVGWQTMTSIVGPGDVDGDGLPDLLARDPSGVLWLYSGNGVNGFPKRTSFGSGWNVMNTLTAAGPLSTGHPGLLARQASNGQLWYYPSIGHGVARVSFGTGWNAMNAMVGGVYLNADGFPDLLVREAATGKLWLYPGTASGGIGAKSVAGTGWQVITAIA